jgi:hypothetical protein
VVHGNSESRESDVFTGFTLRQRAEREKERGNDLFAEGKYGDAHAAYRDALKVVGAWSDKKKGPRLLSVIHGNRSACLLAAGCTEAAVTAARQAVAEDATFEKAWLRLGLALEAKWGDECRDEALSVYQRISANAIAAKRIAMLMAPPVRVTVDGLSGVLEGSLDPSVLAPFPTTGIFFERVYHPSEPLVGGEARYSTHNYGTRALLVDVAERMAELGQNGQVHFVIMESKDPDKQLWLKVEGCFLALPGVAHNGRSRKVSHNPSQIPVLFVQLWLGEREPPVAPAIQPLENYKVDLKSLRAMLLRHAALVSAEAKQRLKVERGYVLSVLTHVAVPELDYSVFEGCCFPGCLVKRADYRCGRCFVPRYCGEDHMTALWKQHKPRCLPLAQREPKMTLDITRGYYDCSANPMAESLLVVPEKTFPAVVVIKVQQFPSRMLKICDPNGVFILTAFEDCEWFAPVEKLFLPHATFSHGGAGFGYFDADMSVEGRVVIFFDRAWKRTW